jgi:hypothetical protein
LIAYGSLMSGLGLARCGRLPVTAVARVRLTACRRGFGKLSMYGDRFAMVLEGTRTDAPIRAEALAADAAVASEGLEAMAFTMALPELVTIAVREGYPAEACWPLVAQAERAGKTLAAHLWTLLENASFDPATYRRALFAAAGHTSPHYVPHPVATSGGEPAIVFLPPGPEGSGSDDVVPIRVQSAVTRVLSLREIWRVKPNADQLDYFAMCLLAEVHGVSLADVYGEVAEDRPLTTRIRTRVTEEAGQEAGRFQELLGLSPEVYGAQLPKRALRSPFLPG